MTVKRAREAARQWMIEDASGVPGFRGAYSAGSTNWLPEEADLPTASDLDIMVVLSDRNAARTRHKFVYQDTLLEVSYLSDDQFESPDRILSDYHLAPSFRTAKMLVDASGHLTPLLAAVSRDYAERKWIRLRCTNAREKILRHLRSIHEQGTLQDQVIALLFAAGITAHVVLVAGLRNPTVRWRYVAVRELLADYGLLHFHETLLELLGSARISRERASRHLVTLTQVFDAARKVIQTPYPFASDISDCARPMAIDGSLEQLARGNHREAMFWIAVTHSRCQQILWHDAPGSLTQSFSESYHDLVADLGMPTFAEVRRRCVEIKRVLPKVCDVAESIMAAKRPPEGGRLA